MWKHPSYYKNLRKLARLRNRVQAISDSSATADRARAPGTGLKPQASSAKQQATDPQAASNKLQAPSDKHQASSRKRQAPQ